MYCRYNGAAINMEVKEMTLTEKEKQYIKQALTKELFERRNAYRSSLALQASIQAEEVCNKLNAEVNDLSDLLKRFI